MQVQEGIVFITGEKKPRSLERGLRLMDYAGTKCLQGIT